MLKKSLIALAVVAMLASCVNAGEIKAHCWPCQFVALEIATIPVTVDIGYYVRIVDQNKLKIKVKQDSADFTKFSGCLNFDSTHKRMKVQTNFALILGATIARASGVDTGTWTVSLTDESDTASGPGVYGSSVSIDVPKGETLVPVCAKLTGVDLYKFMSGNDPQTNVQVATVKITVKPSASPPVCDLTGVPGNGW